MQYQVEFFDFDYQYVVIQIFDNKENYVCSLKVNYSIDEDKILNHYNGEITCFGCVKLEHDTTREIEVFTSIDLEESSQVELLSLDIETQIFIEDEVFDEVEKYTKEVVETELNLNWCFNEEGQLERK